MVESHDRGISFRDNTVVTGDVVGGNKYDIKFYAFASLAGDGQINWAQYRTESKITEPYKFLSYYDTTDADIFFGRETVSQSLTAKITTHKLVLINGKSGSGKTSLINAGIIPQLLQQGYFTMVFRDYGYPTDVIKTGLENLENVALEFNDHDSLLKCLQKTAHQTQSPLAIFLDQFERFFLNLSPQRQTAFIEEFSECLTATNTPNIHFIISIRQDFYGNLGDFWEICQEFHTESYPYNLKLLTTTEATEAIEKPLQDFKIVYDPDFLEQHLVPHLLKGSETESIERIEPVHLQIVCNRLFETVRDRYAVDLKEGKTVIIKESLYQELGKVEGILGSYVINILNNNYSRPEQDEVKSILKQLVTSQGTRTFKSVQEIAETLNIPATKINKVLQRLDQSRLIETIPQDHKYSITHEYLAKQINQWYTLDELELKRARELYERCLTNWKQYRTTIPRSQFKELKQFQKYLKVNSEGEQLFRASSRRYYGRDILITVGLATLVGLTITALIGQRNAVVEQIRTAHQASEAHLFSDSSFEALIKALKAKKLYERHPLLQLWKPEQQLQRRIELILSRVIRESRERHRLWHDAEVYSAQFSPNGNMIATASKDNTARVWSFKGELLAELKGHQGRVYSIQFSPSSNMIITGSDDQTARLWNLQGKLLAELKGHQGRIYKVQFSPDGKTVVTASQDGTAKLWNLQGNNLTNFKGHQERIYSVQFSPDGDTIVTASKDKTARLWNLQGDNIATLAGHTMTVWTAQFSPDSSTVVTASKDKTARLWDRNGKLLVELKGHQEGLSSAQFSPEGNLILTVSSDETARLWNLDGQLITELKGHSNPLIAASFSQQGNFIITTSRDNIARLWNRRGKLLFELRGHQDDIQNAQFSPDGNTIVTASKDKTARLWNLKGEMLFQLIGHQQGVNSAVYSSDGHLIITTSNDKTARLWSSQGKFLVELKGYQGSVYSAQFSSDSNSIITASEDNIVRIWNLKGKLLSSIQGYQDRIISVQFSPEGNLIAVALNNGVIEVWNRENRRILEFKGHKRGINSIQFSSNGNYILTASVDKTARVWDLEGKLVVELKGHLKPVWSAKFSPDDKLIITASYDKTARLWNLDGELLKKFEGHKSGVNNAQFSPKGEYIVTASSDKTARVWNIEGEIIAEIKGHQDEVNSAQFSPDGKSIITASKDGIAKIWNFLSPKELIPEACSRIGYYLKYSPNIEDSDRDLCDGVESSPEL